MQKPNIITNIPKDFNIEVYKEILLHYAVDVLEVDIIEYDISKTIEYFNKLKDEGLLELYDIMTKGDSEHFVVIEQFIRDNFKTFHCGFGCPDNVEIHNVSGYKDFINDKIGVIKYGHDMGKGSRS